MLNKYLLKNFMWLHNFLYLSRRCLWMMMMMDSSVGEPWISLRYWAIHFIYIFQQQMCGIILTAECSNVGWRLGLCRFVSFQYLIWWTILEFSISSVGIRRFLLSINTDSTVSLIGHSMLLWMVVGVNCYMRCRECFRAVFWVNFCFSCTLRWELFSLCSVYFIMWMISPWLLCHLLLMWVQIPSTMISVRLVSDLYLEILSSTLRMSWSAFND